MAEENKIKSENLETATHVLEEEYDQVMETSETSHEAGCESNGGPPEKKLSKREMRRMRQKEAWLASKPAKRAKEREKLKRKRQEARLNNVDLGPSRKMLKSKTMASSNCNIRVAIDMSFDDYMEDRDLSKCLKQLLRCYTLNRRADDPMQLYFTSFSGKCKLHMEKNSGYKNWDVNFKEEYITEVFSNDEIVYLSSESPNTILTLEEDKVYVIGGLVDHNVHKGLCHKIAVNKGLNHGQLPIEEFLKMSCRKVLTIDHVFEILLNVSAGLTWEDAFLKVIPKRKGAVPLSENGDNVEANTRSEESLNVKTELYENLETKITSELNVEVKNPMDLIPKNS